MPGTLSAAIHQAFGEIDIYVFDQLLKGRFDGARAVLDAGCGEGRNLHHLLAQGTTCFGIDRQPEAIHAVRALAAAVAPALPAGNFVTGDIETLPWDDEAFDVVICSAVLHFSRDEAHFDRMVRELWRVLAPGGMLLVRLASVYGPDARPGVRGSAPDGGFRFVVDEAMLLDRTAALGGELLDPIKTTLVHRQRAMTTWVVRKGSRP
jgi:SAM-dependent methyltransferase